MTLRLPGKRILDALLLTIFVMAVAVMAVANEDPLLRNALCSTIKWSCIRSAHFAAWNKLFYDLALGSFVSLVFYLLIVRLPEHFRRLRIKRSFRGRYLAFKQECIEIFLLLADRSYAGGFPESLCALTPFRNYFSEHGGDSQTRWDRVANNLDNHHTQLLLNALEAFREEVHYVLSNIDFDSDDELEFLKRLSRAIASAKVITPGYDTNSLFRFLWSLFAGWDLASGLRETDIVEDMINRI
jgi:hypothetical protein